MTGETRAAEQEGEGRQGAELEFMAFVIQVARRYRSALDQPLRSLGCGTAAMETMSSIANSRRALSQVEIANRMGIEGPTLTRMLALLEQKEWIIRVPDPLDGRAKKIKLTVAGKRALAKVRKSADKIRKDTLARISDEDMEVASKILNRILVGLMNRK